MKKNISIIPKPEKMKIKSGVFVISPETKIWLQPADEAIDSVGYYLADMLNSAGGFKFTADAYPCGKESDASAIVLSTAEADESLGDEGYSLSVQTNKITIKALKPAGLFYGVQTLRQLLPVEIERTVLTCQNTNWTIPCVDIRDVPRYRWRGMHLDVSRHFFDKYFIEKYIDYLALHKLNRFHIHLTDDHGWRVEIEKYPKLTQVGAYRKESMIGEKRNLIGKYNGIAHGGFYTKDEIRDIIAYAQNRFITVIPEIEMPGHCTAALAAYPELSCTGGAFEVGVDWRNYADVFCAGKEETFSFLQDVLSEIIDLFPSEYIHIGGDECRKARWQACPNCQARIGSENLKNEDELQSYFIKRIEKYLISKGRKLLGWDEILEGGLAPEAAVMSWRGIEGGIKAAKQGHDVVMSPLTHCYFDYYQGLPDFEPLTIGSYLTLEQVYTFEPTPSELTGSEAKHILGGQGNMWTEHQATPAEVEYMVFPRISALAEAVWSPAKLRDWDDFCRRMEKQYHRFDLLGINYSKSAFMSYPKSMVNESDNTLMLTFDTQLSNAEIRYSLDGNEPGPESALFEAPFQLKKSTVVKAGIFKNGQLRGPVAGREFIMHKAVVRPVTLLNAPNKKYNIGNYANLTNGMRGTDIFNSGLWTSFEGNNFEAVVDLEEIMPVKKISTEFLQFTGPKIFAPATVEFAVSLDGENFEVVAKIENDLSEKKNEPTIKNFEYELDETTARYVRVIAQNRGVCPLWHPKAGEPAWLFVDEIVVE